MNDKELTDADFEAAARALGCSVAAIKAVCEVESPKGGFFPDGTPTTLFEAHWFCKFTKGRFTKSHPHLSQPTWELARRYYGKTWQAEVARRAEACALSREAALMSASWGRFQIMGFNFGACGYVRIQSFITAMFESERRHLDAFVQFVISRRLDDELRDGRVEAFVIGYNGSGQVPVYTPRLVAAFLRHGGTTWAGAGLPTVA